MPTYAIQRRHFLDNCGCLEPIPDVHVSLECTPHLMCWKSLHCLDTLLRMMSLYEDDACADGQKGFNQTADFQVISELMISFAVQLGLF